MILRIVYNLLCQNTHDMNSCAQTPYQTSVQVFPFLTLFMHAAIKRIPSAPSRTVGKRYVPGSLFCILAFRHSIKER